MKYTARTIPGRRFSTPVVFQLATTLVLLAFVTSAFGFSISSVEAIREADDSIVVAMDCNIELSPDVVEALESNIPITILTNIKLYRVRANLWDKLIHEFEIQDEIAYRSLYRTYRVSSTDTNISADYTSLERVLNALGNRRIHQLVLSDGQLDPNDGYRGKVKILLDRSTLPSVMRVPVFFKNSWRLQSTPVRFDIQ